MALKVDPAIIRIDGLKPEPAALQILPEAAAREHQMLPLWLENHQLVAAAADASDERNLRAVQILARRPVRPLQAGYQELQDAITRYYRKEPHRLDPQRPGPIDTLYLLGYLDEQQAAQARAAVGLAAGDTVAEAQVCRRLGLVEPTPMAEALGLVYHLPHLQATGPEPAPELTALIPAPIARERGVLPLRWLNGTLVVGMAEAEALDCLEGLDQVVGAPVQPVVCPLDLWDRYYLRLYVSPGAPATDHEKETVRRLVERKRLTPLDVTGASAAAQQTGRSIQSVLIENRLIEPEDWLQAIARVSGVPREGKGDRVDSAEALMAAGVQLPLGAARRLGFAPLYLEGDELIIALEQPNPAVEKLVRHITGRKVQSRLVSTARLNALQNRLESAPRLTRVQSLPPLSELLVQLGVVTTGQIEEVRTEDDELQLPGSIGERLVRAGYLDDYELAGILSLQTGLPVIRLDHFRFDRVVIATIPARLANERQMLPLWAGAEELWMAVANPLDALGLTAAEKAAGMRVRTILAPASAIQAALQRLILPETARSVSSAALSLVNRLSEHGYLTQVQATEVLQRYAEEGLPLDEAILVAAPISDVALGEAFSNLLGIPVISLDLEDRPISVIDALGNPVERNQVHDPVDLNAALLIDQLTAERLSALPVDSQGSRLRVAFADPIFEAARKELEDSLGRPIVPVLAARRSLNEAIQRHLGRRNLGAYLLMAGEITRGQLNDALDYARRTGVRVGHALVNRGYLTWQQLYRSLSEQFKLPFYELENVEIDEELARRIDPTSARANGILPLYEADGQVVLAIVDPLDEDALEIAARALEQPVQPVLATENDLDAALERIYHEEYLYASVCELLERSPEDSAYQVLSRGQQIAIIAFVLFSGIWLALDHISYLIVINAIFTVYYVALTIYKLYLIYRALSHDLEVPVSQEEIDSLKEVDLPVYTILVPVYREAEVLPELLNSLRRLEYPQTKLDIKILMEANDPETVAAFQNWGPPSHFHGVIVPPGQPQTKPKACNYGLLHARGDYVVIFDAEDMPDPDQLKKIVVAFRKSSPRIACIQSKLNYYNRNQNLLTRWFTVEYSMWFDLFLPGLDASGAPIPLGGTSNHFRRDALVEIGAWDPYNVTEDADLGVRLYKRGYKTAIIDSTTFEEANSRVNNWIRQRSRWIKGYIQTWLVHMRHPVKLWNEIGPKAFMAFQFVVGGTFFAALMNPIYWLLTTLWFVLEWELIQEIFPGVIFYLGGLCLFLGNFAFTYMNVAGAMRRRYYGMVKYALLSPLYWGLASIGAWKGLWQLITKPHFWEKTKHGLFAGTPDVEATPTAEKTAA